MYILKGFMVISPLADNTVNVIAPLGEISTQSYTYAKEKGHYSSADYRDVILTTFRSENIIDDVHTLTGVPIPHQSIALRLGQWVYNKAEVGELTSNYVRCQEQLQTEFGTVITNIQIGEMKTDRVRWMPEWVSYSLLGSDNEVKIWFCDESFQLQYDEYEMQFVPALEPLDTFFLDPLLVKDALAARSVTEVFNRIEEVKNKQPYTTLSNQEFEYKGQDSVNTRIMTNWAVMVWGIAGNNPDIIKEELAKHILKESEYSEDDWITIFPDIFTNTEHIIMPLWDKYAIPNRTIVTGMYTPTLNLVEAISLAYAATQGKGYYREHIDRVVCMSSTLFKSLAFVTVGGPYNRDGIFRFDERMEDYIIVPTSSPDYNRMSIKTQEWIRLFYDMLVVAEHATPISSIPLGMSRVVRKGVVYIAASYDRVLYLVLTRYSVMDIEQNPGKFPWIEPKELFLTNASTQTFLTNPSDEFMVRPGNGGQD